MGCICGLRFRISGGTSKRCGVGLCEQWSCVDDLWIVNDCALWTYSVRVSILLVEQRAGAIALRCVQVTRLCLSGAASEMLAVVGCVVTSQILSANCAVESRLLSVCPARIACTCGGRRLAQNCAEEVIRNVWCEAFEMSKELRWFTITHFFVRKELSDALFA